jgi:hypothetical protein
MAVPNAANGQEEPDAVRAELAARIQYVRVEWGMPLTISSGLEIGCCDAFNPLYLWAKAVFVKATKAASRALMRDIFILLQWCLQSLYRYECYSNGIMG